MMMTKRALVRFVAATIFGFAHAGTALAQNYPNRPIKMIVPFPAGGPTDFMARLIADRLSAALGQTIVVENRGGGGGGSVGAKAVATADPDGYTLLLTPPGPLSIAPAVYRKLDYDPVKDFVPIALLIATPLVLTVNPALPVHSLPELVAYAKSHPGQISLGTQGYGTAPHLLGELLKLEAGIDIVHVPYRGTAPALADLMAGQVQMFFDTTTVVVPQIRAGKLRPLAVTSEKRNFQLPDVPTTTEAGFPKMVSLFWLGMVAPAGTPADIVARLNSVINESMRAPDVRARFADLGAELRLGTPQDLANLISAEIKKWTAVTSAAGIKVD
jgi:tripartite-type tricarboxylate transporter receptor subunit TctC